ncbi:MAG: hypothetical protein KGO82_08450 [Bacteroidota bacterium]|nr:hypothetical protein [Bacteroidota bacterium]
MTPIEIITWLNQHPLIKVNALEKAAGVPSGALDKAMKGNRPLPEKYIVALIDVLQHYGMN